MKNTEKLKEEKHKLELKIRELISDFIINNGQCEITINTDYQYIENNPTDKRLAGFILDVDLKIK